MEAFFLALAINRAVTAKVRRILKQDLPCEKKYQLLDQLYLQTTEHHPDGVAAGVLGVIAQAETQVLYPNWKGGDGKR